MTAHCSKARVFVVDYPFLSCGSVFTDGLAHAAVDLGIDYAHAQWDTPDLSDQIAAFAPDLLLVVHGRMFARRFPNVAGFGCRSAVWLLDEPYEVDETSSWSHRFDSIFISDPATMHRHPRATYLPVCYDPHVHRAGPHQRIRKVGFIGGANPTRERYLAALARAGTLDYVVGGDWHDEAINAVCLGRNVRPQVTAQFYSVTKIVLNVFRETHHFNRDYIQATSLNPRVYEALACGALVVSEWRDEVEAIVPELPTFRTEAECLALVNYLLTFPEKAETIRLTCAAALAGHTYADRLRTVLATVGQAVAA